VLTFENLKTWVLRVIAHYRINGKLGESVMARRIAGRSFGNANLAQNALWR
jgi:hypothetical protein